MYQILVQFQRLIFYCIKDNCKLQYLNSLSTDLTKNELALVYPKDRILNQQWIHDNYIHKYNYSKI